MLAIPAQTALFEFTDVHDVVDLFEPPLIAKTASDFEAYLRVRASLVQMIRGSFYVFPCSGQSVLLASNGKYLMVAGIRALVERVIGTTVEASWDPVRANDQLDPLLLFRLRSAMAAYGVQA